MRSNSALICLGLAVLMSSASAATAFEAPSKFEFRKVEFMEGDTRLQAVHSFLNAEVRPGMPLEDAMRAVARAGAQCRRPDRVGADAVCTYDSTTESPDTDLDDIVWQVRITPGPDGASVASTSVTRTRYGD